MQAVDLARFYPLLSYLARQQRIPRGCLLERRDLVGEACVTLLGKLGRFDPERGSLTGFVKSVGQGAMLEAIRFSMRIRGSGRSARRWAAPKSLEDVARLPPAPDRDLLEQLSVADALRLLPRGRRELVIRHWMDGESARALAQEAGRTEDWAYRELWLARPVLRKALA